MFVTQLSSLFALAGFLTVGQGDSEREAVSSERPVKILKPTLSTAFSRGTLAHMEVSGNGRYLAAATRFYVNLWDLESGEHLRCLPSDYPDRRVLFSPAGDLLVDDEKHVVLHPLAEGNPKALAVKGALLDFSADGKTLLTAEGKDLVLWNWPACTRRAVITLPTKSLSAAISPDGKTAVIGLEETKFALVDLPEARMREYLPFRFQGSHRVAGFCPAGQLVIGVANQHVEAWNLLTRSRARQFDGPPADVDFGVLPYFRSLAVAAAGRRAAATHRDGFIRVYETVSGQMLAKLGPHSEKDALAMSPDGTRVFAGKGDQQILVWDVSPRRLPAERQPVSEEALAKAFDDLGVQSAQNVQKTLATLQANPDQSVAFFAKKLRPVAAVDGRLVEQLFRDLDGPSFTGRATADRQLRALGPAAVPGIRERAAGALSLEMKLRVQKLLDYADGPNPGRVRFSRALDVLADVNTPEARKLVVHLTHGVVNAWETEAARRALAEMNARAAQK